MYNFSKGKRASLSGKSDYVHGMHARTGEAPNGPRKFFCGPHELHNVIVSALLNFAKFLLWTFEKNESFAKAVQSFVNWDQVSCSEQFLLDAWNVSLVDLIKL